MNENEANAYILGTDREELHRLGLQHRVWAGEATRGWDAAGFTAGQTLLDLGCGPGFCTQELAYIVGENGRMIGVDLSEEFIEHARAVNRLHALNIDYRANSFDDMQLESESLDGAYCRWALAWVPNPAEIIARVVAALRPGAMFVAHEYHDWKTFQTEPHRPALAAGIAAALKSFRESEGDIDIGRRLPAMFHDQGLEVSRVRPMSKVALPGTLTWQWPDSFFDNYLPRVVSLGLLDEETRTAAVDDWRDLESTSGAVCLCPQMVEVIGCKPEA